MEWLNNILSNQDLIKRIRTVSIMLLALGLPLLFFGLWESLSFKSLLSVNIGALGFVTLISVWAARLEVGSIGYEMEIESNKPLNEIKKELKNKINNFDNNELGREFIDEYNIKQQERANYLLTQKTISKLKYKLRSKQISGKSYGTLEEEIRTLELNPLYNKKYKTIKYEDIVNSSDDPESNIEIGEEEFVYNPKTHGKLLQMFISSLKYFAIGGNVAAAFVINDLGMVIRYYLILIITIIVTSTNEYISVRYKTANRYLQVQRNRLQLVNKMLDYKPKETIYIDNEQKKQCVGITSFTHEKNNDAKHNPLEFKKNN